MRDARHGVQDAGRTGTRYGTIKIKIRIRIRIKTRDTRVTGRLRDRVSVLSVSSVVVFEDDTRHPTRG